jgi:DNA-binding FrmR family transcriptional regulator
MQLEPDVSRDVINRLRRVQGQVAGIAQMLEDGRDCADVVTQLSAASRALNRAGFKVGASGLRQCIEAEEAGNGPELSRDQLEKLFLSLA